MWLYTAYNQLTLLSIPMYLCMCSSVTVEGISAEVIMTRLQRLGEILIKSEILQNCRVAWVVWGVCTPYWIINLFSLKKTSGSGSIVARRGVLHEDKSSTTGTRDREGKLSALAKAPFGTVVADATRRNMLGTAKGCHQLLRPAV